MINLRSILKKRKNIALILASFFFLEITSFLSYYFLGLNIAVFILLTILTFVLSLYKLEWGFYLLIGELLCNSMGYIFFLENSGLKISLRIALWSTLLLVWGGKFILELIKDRKALWQRYLKMPYLKYFLTLLFFIFFGFFYGIIKNNFNDAFFDFNAWLYFLLIFPLWHILSSFKGQKLEKFYQNIVSIFVAAVLFLVFKSLILLFLFSHNIGFISDLYYWTRDYRLGEITSMEGGFYRIFLQSQIFILLAWIIFLASWNKLKNKKDKVSLFIFLSLLSSALILSFSRSFWLAGILTLLILLIFLWKKNNFKVFLKTVLLASSSLLIGFLLVFLVVKFPWPNSMVKFDLNSLSERAKVVKSDEAAVSSRWALLEVMKDDLFSNFFLGRGFGARLEYQSSDPRVLENSPDGIYSTYAFEWGWFDIYLKIGLLGMLSYLLLLYFFLKEAVISFFKNDNYWYLGLGLALVSLMIVNFFTPYLNHPLGIGFVILVLLIFAKKQN